MHLNLVTILGLFNFGKNSFIVLIPVDIGARFGVVELVPAEKKVPLYEGSVRPVVVAQLIEP